MSVIKQVGVKQSNGTYSMTDIGVKAKNIEGNVVVWNLLPAVDETRIGWENKTLLKNVHYDYSNGTYTLVTNTPASGAFQNVYTYWMPMNADMLAMRGKTCTFHIDDITTSYSGGNPRAYLQISINGTDTTGGVSIWIDIANGKNTVRTFTMPATASHWRLFLRADQNQNRTPADTTVVFKGIKLEEGSVATDWTPNLEDINQYIVGLDNKTTDSAIVNTVATNMKIGGRNLLLNSKDRELTPHTGATLTFTKNQTVTEWGATDAIRVTGTPKSDYQLFATLSDNIISVSNKKYVFSIYIKNNGTENIFVNANSLGSGSVAAIAPNESKRLMINAVGNGSYKLLFTFKTTTSGANVDFIYWHPQIEEGDIGTDWQPAPDDNAKASDLGILATKNTVNVSTVSSLGNIISNTLEEYTLEYPYTGGKYFLRNLAKGKYLVLLECSFESGLSIRNVDILIDSFVSVPSPDFVTLGKSTFSPTLSTNNYYRGYSQTFAIIEVSSATDIYYGIQILFNGTNGKITIQPKYTIVPLNISSTSTVSYT